MDAFVSFVWNYVAFLGSCFIIICFIALIYLIFFDKPVMGKSNGGGGGGGNDDFHPKLPPDRPPGQKLLTQKNNSPSITRAVKRERVG